MRLPIPVRAGFFRAFTLIELLIVVAIIAILAAIAVPNFLEAQTRSKVSRTQADMRTMTVALEAYKLDNNLYPVPLSILTAGGAIVYPMPSSDHSLYAHNTLPPQVTTPIAYVTSTFPDVFSDTGLQPSPQMQQLYYQNWELTKRLAERDGITFMPAQNARSNSFGSWILSSYGPDRDNKDLAPAKVGPTLLVNGVYDATNGTISNGDIIRTQRNPAGIGL